MTEYIIQVEYDEKSIKQQEEVLSGVASHLGTAKNDLFQPNFNATLNEQGYRAWFSVICMLDPSFIMAPHFWSRGEYWVSPKTGDQTLVTRID